MCILCVCILVSLMVLTRQACFARTQGPTSSEWMDTAYASTKAKVRNPKVIQRRTIQSLQFSLFCQTPQRWKMFVASQN